MKVLISGHRTQKLCSYSVEWIKEAIEFCIEDTPEMSTGLSGMAGGVDLWFCELCFRHSIPYIACPPFDEQEQTIPNQEEKDLRKWCMENSSDIWKVRNQVMVSKCDIGIIVFDGNKGGTHNVFQQMIENKKPFHWINPVSEKIWKCF